MAKNEHQQKTDQVVNFRNGLIAKRKEIPNLKQWTHYSRNVCIELEKKGTLLNNQLKGELSEVVLEQYLLELQKLFKHFGVHSTIIKNLGLVHRSESNDILYSSEIDICLVTEHRAYLFEVKSYKGEKTLTDKCMLNGIKQADIHGQSVMHLDFFEMLFDDCRIKYTSRDKTLRSPYKLLFFEFSGGSITDLRTAEWKRNLPYIHVDNLFIWFEKELSEQEDIKARPQWDLRKLNERFKQLDANRELIMDYHIKRLKNKQKGK